MSVPESQSWTSQQLIATAYSGGRAHGDVWSPLTGLAWWIMGRSSWSGIKWAVEMAPRDHGAVENGRLIRSFLRDPNR